jgi:hypothetical protein
MGLQSKVVIDLPEINRNHLPLSKEAHISDERNSKTLQNEKHSLKMKNWKHLPKINVETFCLPQHHGK